MSRINSVLSCTKWVVILCLFGVSQALGDISYSGNFYPTVPTAWDSDTNAYVAKTSAATLGVDDGSDLLSNSVYIGFDAGVTGVATVDGAGSTWTIDHDLYAGGSGDGTLNINNGGAVSNAGDGGIGWDSGSEGVATVDGSGSTWTMGGELYVGNDGRGTLNITDGGAVNNTVGYIGFDSSCYSTGVVNVNGSGSTWTNSGALRVGQGTTSTGTEAIASGTLNITDGGTVSSSGAQTMIAYHTDSEGYVTVDGAGSTWTVNSSSYFYVGYNGDATLNITDGGAVLVGNSDGHIGRYSNSTSTVTVTGAGSKLYCEGSLDLGIAGSGVLQITNGGLVIVDGGLTIDGSDSNDFINMSTGSVLAILGNYSSSLTTFLAQTGGGVIRYWDYSTSSWANITSATLNVDYTLNYVSYGGSGYTTLTVGRYPGDYNWDGSVDIADYTVCADTWGDTGSDLPADGNHDGVVTISDYTVWADNYGVVVFTAPPLSPLPTGLSFTYSSTDLGDGLTGYTFKLNDTSANSLSWAADMIFSPAEGDTIIQQQFGVVVVDGEGAALIYDGLGDPPYDMYVDTWVFEEFTALLNGIYEDDGDYRVRASTWNLDTYSGEIDLVYIVSDGDVEWSGTISRDGEVYSDSGSTAD